MPGTTILHFGNHQGKCLQDAPLKYLLFLAGFCLSGTRKAFCDEPESKWVHFHRPSLQ